MGGVRFELRLVTFENGSIRHQLLRRDLVLDSTELVAEIEQKHAWELASSLLQWAGDFKNPDLTGYPGKEHAYAFPKREGRLFHPWTPAEIHAVGVLKELGWSNQEIGDRMGRNKDSVRHKLKELGI